MKYICDTYQAYLEGYEEEMPCKNCAAWIENTETCLCEEELKNEIKKQAVNAFAEELKERYCNLDYLPSGDEFCEIVDESIKERYGEG